MNVLRVRHVPHDRAICAHCRQMILEVDGIGWLDPDAGDTYDICPDDAYGNHEPEPPPSDR